MELLWKLKGGRRSRWEGHSAEESKAQGAKELAGEVAEQGADPVRGAVEPGISAVLYSPHCATGHLFIDQNQGYTTPTREGP